MRRSRSSFAPLMALAVLLIASPLVSCGGKKSSEPKPQSNSTSADTLVQHANLQLESILYAQIHATTPPGRPSDLNLGAPEQLYRQALATEPANGDANFGVAVLGLMSLTYDPEVNAAFDEWNTYLQSHVPFRTGATRGRPLGVPAGLSAGLSGLHLPYQLVPLSMVANLRASQVATDPQISRIQDIFSQRVLPKLADAITHLSTAAAQPTFEFTITPLMQGSASAPPILVHSNDLIVLRAACELLTAACDVGTAYQLGFASYDSTGIVGAFTPGSSWLSLAGSGGAAGRGRMADARLKMLASIVDAKTAINTLLTQTGNHDNDLIKLPPGARGRAEAESLNVNLTTASQALTSGYTWTADWDADYTTPDTPLNIRVDHVFTSPVADWKALLPSYTAQAVRRPFEVSYQYESGTTNHSVHVTADGYYYGSYYLSVYASSPPYEYYYGLDSLRTPLMAVAQAEIARISALPGFTGEYSISTSFDGNLVAGSQVVPVAWWDNYPLSVSNVFVPQITWNANSAAAWIWPDPTMGGVFPSLTTSEAFLQTFGFKPGQWTKVNVLDWTGVRYWW